MQLSFRLLAPALALGVVACAQSTPNQPRPTQPVAQTPAHPAMPCDPGEDCDLVAQWDQSGVLPPDPDSDYYYSRVMQQVVGSRFPMQPLTNTQPRMGGPADMGPVTGSENEWTLTPMWSSSYGAQGPYTAGPDPFDCCGDDLPGSAPNEFEALTVQGVFQDDMWEEGKQNEQFAARTIFMLGSSTAALANLIAGIGKTYPEDYESVPFMNYPKYVVGSMSHGAHAKGGTFWDTFSAMGGVNFGWAAFDSITFDPNTPKADWCLSGDAETCAVAYGLFVAMAGAENDSFFGNRITTSDTDGNLMSGADLRSLAYKEDDAYSPVPAIAISMRGSQNSSLLDTTMLPGIELPYSYYNENFRMTTRNNPGFVLNAVGSVGGVYAMVKNSFINTYEAIGFHSSTAFVEFLERPVDMDCPDERCESRISCLYQFLADPVTFDRCTNIDEIFGSSIGIFLPDPVPNSGGGQPPACQTCPTMDCNDGGALPIERYASLVARGSVFLGDGHVAAGDESVIGYDTDVVHINDVMHLVPRSAPPTLDPNLAPEDKTGLVYFDLTRGTLRVSVPASSNADEHWTESAVVWMDVQLAADAVDPSRDIAGVQDNHALRATAVEEIHNARAAANDRAARGESHYAQPVVRAIPLARADFQHEEGAVEISLQLSGFAGHQPQIFYRAIRRHHNNSRLPDLWQEVDMAAYSSEGLPPGFGSVPAMIELEEGFHGIVEIMAIDPVTGRSTGTSFFSSFGGV